MSHNTSLFARWQNRLAFWCGSGMVTLGVALHLPMFWMGRKMGFRLVGMPMDTGMLVGMGLIILGVIAAAYGLLFVGPDLLVKRRVCIVRRVAIKPGRSARAIPLPGDVCVEDRLVLEFVTAKALGKRVFCPDDLAARLEDGGFHRVLKLALPRRRMTNVQRGSGIWRSADSWRTWQQGTAETAPQSSCRL